VTLTDHDAFLSFFSFLVLFHKNLLPREGIPIGIIHQRCIGGGCGRKNLHLFGEVAQRFRGELSKGLHVAHGASGMSRHQVVGQKYLGADFSFQPVEKPDKWDLGDGI